MITDNPPDGREREKERGRKKGERLFAIQLRAADSESIGGNNV